MSDSTMELSPPHDLYAERVVLGAALEDGGIPAGARGFEPHDFYSPAHRAIFAAMLRLDAMDVSITVGGIYAELQRTGEAVLLPGLPLRVQ